MCRSGYNVPTNMERYCGTFRMLAAVALIAAVGFTPLALGCKACGQSAHTAMSACGHAHEPADMPSGHTHCSRCPCHESSGKTPIPSVRAGRSHRIAQESPASFASLAVEPAVPDYDVRMGGAPHRRSNPEILRSVVLLT